MESEELERINDQLDNLVMEQLQQLNEGAMDDIAALIRQLTPDDAAELRDMREDDLIQDIVNEIRNDMETGGIETVLHYANETIDGPELEIYRQLNERATGNEMED